MEMIYCITCCSTHLHHTIHFIAYCFTLHYIALQCIACHCITNHRIVLHCITLHYMAIHGITSQYIALHWLHYIALHYITLHYNALHGITWHCITLHCIALHCITLHYIPDIPKHGRQHWTVILHEASTGQPIAWRYGKHVQPPARMPQWSPKSSLGLGLARSNDRPPT